MENSASGLTTLIVLEHKAGIGTKRNYQAELTMSVDDEILRREGWSILSLRYALRYIDVLHAAIVPIDFLFSRERS